MKHPTLVLAQLTKIVFSGKPGKVHFQEQRILPRFYIATAAEEIRASIETSMSFRVDQ